MLLVGCARPPAGPPRLPRVGLLAPGSEQAYAARVQAVEQGLRERGYVPNQTVALEYRYADGGREELLTSLAEELLRVPVDVIVAVGSASIRPARDAALAMGANTPIVMVSDAADPVSAGYVASLAHPGGNVTGLSGLSPQVTAKRLELLRDAIPSLRRVAVMRNPDSPDRDALRTETELAASILHIALQPLDIRGTADVEGAFEAAAGNGAEGLLVLRDPVTNSNRAMIVALAARHRLPAMYASREGVDEGGLMSYGANVYDLYRRTAQYVDRIVRGARAADLPVEQPTRLEFVVNLRTAAALGLTFPEAVLRQATDVLE
jgi:putative tryptophan/tyrosine transport system substrate-binding protein